MSEGSGIFIRNGGNGGPPPADDDFPLGEDADPETERPWWGWRDDPLDDWWCWKPEVLCTGSLPSSTSDWKTSLIFVLGNRKVHLK